MSTPTWTPGEVPPADEVTAAYWEATREHRLTVQQCTCGHRQHPPRALCTACGATDALTQTDVDGTGSVDASTVVHRAPRADVPVPYVVARVRLDEGPLVLTRLDGRADPESWAIGDAVVVAWTDLPDGRALPSFFPISTVVPQESR